MIIWKSQAVLSKKLVIFFLYTIRLIPDDQSGNIYRQITVPLKFLGKRESEKYKGQKNNLVEGLVEDSEMV